MSNELEQKRERELDWEDTIENDSDFTILPEGDYDFEVVEFERARHAGSEKIPPCNKAVVSLKIKSDTDETTIKHNLYLHSKTEGMLCAFFSAIGQRQHGEKLKMDWSKVVGSTGRAKIEIKKITKDDGTVAEFNQVKKFYDFDGSKGYTPGKF